MSWTGRRCSAVIRCFPSRLSCRSSGQSRHRRCERHEEQGPSSLSGYRTGVVAIVRSALVVLMTFSLLAVSCDWEEEVHLAAVGAAAADTEPAVDSTFAVAEGTAEDTAVNIAEKAGMIAADILDRPVVDLQDIAAVAYCSPSRLPSSPGQTSFPGNQTDPCSWSACGEPGDGLEVM